MPLSVLIHLLRLGVDHGADELQPECLHRRIPCLGIQTVVHKFQIERFLMDSGWEFHQEGHEMLLDFHRRVLNVVWVLLGKEHAKVSEDHLIDESR